MSDDIAVVRRSASGQPLLAVINGAPVDFLKPTPQQVMLLRVRAFTTGRLEDFALLLMAEAKLGAVA